MSHINRSCYKSEVKSKIGDYIRGKISAQSLMHPSRVNTKPIDKRKYNLHSGFQYEATRTDYQKKIRRPPLKDYIEGKVKLCDMISPSKITYIPKERKYQNLLPTNDAGATASAAANRDEQRVSFGDDSLEAASTSQDAINGGGGGGGKYKDEWDLTTKYHGAGGGNGYGGMPQKSTTIGGAAAATTTTTMNEYSLVPIRGTGYGPAGKRKLMCKIKVQQNGNGENGKEAKTEEHIIEIPEKILRRGHGLPKFLMDRYNIPCFVNGSAATAAGKQHQQHQHQHPHTKRKQQLSILDGCSAVVVAAAAVAGTGSGPGGANATGGALSKVAARNETVDGESSSGQLLLQSSSGGETQAIEYHPISVAAAGGAAGGATGVGGGAAGTIIANGENGTNVAEVAIICDGSTGGNATTAGNGAAAATGADVDNLPSEQGDYNNNATTYVFEFYEEDVLPQETKSAIIEEIEDDHISHGREYAKSYTEDTRGFNHRNAFEDCSLRSDEFHHYEDFKSNIYVQRELMDLHRGMLKCDKNFMVVEHNVNQVTATLNKLETVQNHEIKPTVANLKTDSERMRHHLQNLQSEHDELKKSIQYFRKKTTDYDKAINFIRQDNGLKFQDLENKLETITQTQVKSIEMQNSVNKNFIQITQGIKRVQNNEQDSKHCCNSIKSPKNSNLTIL